MNKINKIMKLAQDCLDEKWFIGNSDSIFQSCPYCCDLDKHDRDECLCPKEICNCNSKGKNVALMDYISKKCIYARIVDMDLKDLELMRQALQETAETGGISKFTRKEIERRFKEL